MRHHPDDYSDFGMDGFGGTIPLSADEAEAVRGVLGPGATEPEEIDATQSSARKAPEVRGKSIALSPGATPGIIGEIVTAATANSEADPAAVAATVLGFAAASLGRARYQMIGDERHHPNLFLAIVGDSSSGRKGTSMSGPRTIFNAAEDCIEQLREKPFPLGCRLKKRSGLSTGEGLAFEIRDAGEKTDDNQDPDPGEPDKRILVNESELVQIFKVSARPGNTLSVSLRRSWDGETLAPMTKTSRISATSPHVNIIGHITAAELSTSMSETDTANGLANRFLWCFSKRPRLVPLPRPMPTHEIERLGQALADLIVQAHKQSGEMVMTKAAENYWVSELYADVETLPDNALGVILRRGAPYVRRLAMVYAMLDGSGDIDERHLRSAKAFWDYSTASARMIFGDRQVDGKAQRILDVLDEFDGEMNRSQLRKDVFSNKPPANLSEILLQLEAAGEITSRKHWASAKATRPQTLYRRAVK